MTTTTPASWQDHADTFGRIRRGPRMSGRTWQDNADEFGGIVNGTTMGWSLAVLVACSVTTDSKGGGTGANQHGAAATPVAAAPCEKVSAREFAKRAGVSDMSVRRYFEGWAKAIAAGADVPPAADLSPSDVGTFPLPSKPFNGPGGYVSTKNVGNGSAAVQVQNIVDGHKIASEVAKSVSAMTKLMNLTPPKQFTAVADEIDDDVFEAWSEAIAAASIPAPAKVTPTGVTPAHTPSPVKAKAAQKAADKIQQVKINEALEKLKAASPKVAPEDKIVKPDGHVHPVVDKLHKLDQSADLWNAEPVRLWLTKTLEAVLAYEGPLTPDDDGLIEEFLTEIEGVIAKIRHAVDFKRGSTVPDVIPDDWA